MKFMWDGVVGNTYQPEMAVFGSPDDYQPLSSPVPCLKNDSMWVMTPGEGLFRVRAWTTIVGGSEGQDV